MTTKRVESYRRARTRFAIRMSERRIRIMLPRNAIAQMIGVHPNHVTRLENGWREPSLELAAKIAAVLGTSIDYLVGSTNDPTRLP